MLSTPAMYNVYITYILRLAGLTLGPSRDELWIPAQVGIPQIKTIQPAPCLWARQPMFSMHYTNLPNQYLGTIPI